MKESRGNLWEFYNSCSNSVACITTNGVIKADGALVMGRGCALGAKLRFPGLDLKLGQLVQRKGNTVFFFKPERLLSFPTKHDWKQPSDINLIVRSARCLAELADQNRNHIFYLPRPGCSNGGLNWEDVKLVIESILPDNVVVITF